MRIAASVIALLCGIVVLVGVFLPWAGVSGWGFNMTVSGWDGIDFSISEAMDAFLVFIGGIVMVLCALPALVLSLTGKGVRAAMVPLGAFAVLGALAAAGGSAWFIADMVSEGVAEYMEYGIYLCSVGAVLGLIFGIVGLTSKS